MANPDSPQHQDSFPKSQDELLTDVSKRAERIIAEAELQARKRAHEMLAITLETERNRILEEAKSTAALEAKRILAEAGEKASEIIERAKREAEAKANTIIEEAGHAASSLAKEMLKQAGLKASKTIAQAEQEARQIIEDANTKATSEATRILAEAQQKANQMLEEVKNVSSKIIAEAKHKANHIIEQAGQKSEPIIEEVKGETLEEASKIISEVGLSAECTGDNKKERIQETSEEQDLKLFNGDLELELIPPVQLDTVVTIHKHLKQFTNIDVLNMKGSADKGIIIRIFIKTPIPCLRFIRELPMVEKASEASILELDQKREEQLLKKIVIATR